jgi:hypothetical protein
MLFAVTAFADTDEQVRTLDASELRLEAKANAELDAYLDRNGYPDVARTRPLSDRPPWADREVVLYYLDSQHEIAFTRAVILGKESIDIQRFEAPLTDEEVAALSTQPSMRTQPTDGALASLDRSAIDPTSNDPADRAEAAAFRAEQAAGRVEEAALRTENAATRAETVVEKLMAVKGR